MTDRSSRPRLNREARTPRRQARQQRKRGLGYAFIHHAVDDHSPLAYSEILDAEKEETAAAFWIRANAHYHRPMAPPTSSDPLGLGQKLMTVLEGGRRVATYKLAVLIALLDTAVELVPDDLEAAVAVDLDRLTDRIIELYWRQMRPLDGTLLKQSNDGRGVIFTVVADLRHTMTTGRLPPLATVITTSPDLYRSTHQLVKATLVRYPLKLLQNVSDSNSDRFLYDDSWMGTGSHRIIGSHGNQLVLFPGVCFTLARLAPLLKPVFQLEWVNDVRRMNRSVLKEGPDLAEHLFGADRVALAVPRTALAEAFGLKCFYCGRPLTDQAQVDHILPWSKVAIDGLANLVLACARCNLSKSDRLPSPTHVQRALARGRPLLDEISATIDWPCQFDRVLATAHGLYATQPEASPIWVGNDHIGRLSRSDFVWF